MNMIFIRMNSYQAELTNKIISIVNDNPATLCEIIKDARGAYPNDVKEILNILIENKKITFSNKYYNSKHSIVATNATELPDVEKSDLNYIDKLTSNLSKPHPADYDWRFTNETIYKLIDELKDHGNSKIDLALFGVTTLFPVLREYCKKIDVDLYNKSQSLISDLKHMGYNDGLYHQDLFKPINNNKRYDIIIADPPWYNDFYKAFIYQSSEVLKSGGVLFLSVLPELTRPDAKKDRALIKKFCEINGLAEIEIKSNFLTYESPVFERNALKNSGIDCADWRKGDLIIYKNVGCGSKEMTVSPPEDEPLWNEYIVNEVKLKILSELDANDEFNFENVDNTPVLSSVSRRSNLRKRINFWTSDNVALNVKKLKVLHSFFNYLKAGNSAEVAFEIMKQRNEVKINELLRLKTLILIANIVTSG